MKPEKRILDVMVPEVRVAYRELKRANSTARPEWSTLISEVVRRHIGSHHSMEDFAEWVGALKKAYSEDKKRRDAFYRTAHHVR